jgi:hypothetical protein
MRRRESEAHARRTRGWAYTGATGVSQRSIGKLGGEDRTLAVGSGEIFKVGFADDPQSEFLVLGSQRPGAHRFSVHARGGGGGGRGGVYILVWARTFVSGPVASPDPVPDLTTYHAHHQDSPRRPLPTRWRQAHAHLCPRAQRSQLPPREIPRRYRVQVMQFLGLWSHHVLMSCRLK